MGFTRAEERLYLLRAFRRGFMGSNGPTIASRFLKEVPSELIASPKARTSSRTVRPSTIAPAFWTKWQPSPGAQTVQGKIDLNIGDLVRHAVFGEGVVMSYEPSGDDHEVTVQFEGNVGMKRLLASFAPLKKVEG
mgnify:CR=1 FL=1